MFQFVIAILLLVCFSGRLSNRTAADEIMLSVRNTISSYPFLISDITTQVRILTGAEEGMFSWISTNFLSGKFYVSLFSVYLLLVQ